MSLMAFLPQILLVKASWTEGDGYNLGSWDYYADYDWSGIDDANECYFNYTQNVNNFQTWSFKVDLVDFGLTGLWWISTMRQETWIKISNNNNLSEYVTGRFLHVINPIAFGYAFLSGWDFPESNYLLRGSNYPLAIGVNITKYTNVKMNIEISVFEGITTISQRDSYTVSNGFFNNVTISYRVFKSLEFGAEGWFRGEKTDEVITSGLAISTIGGIEWGSDVFNFKGNTVSLTSIITPAIIFGAIAGSFSIVGSRLDEHGTAGFMIGGCIALVVLVQSSIMPSWIFAVIILLGVLGLYFWWR